MYEIRDATATTREAEDATGCHAWPAEYWQATLGPLTLSRLDHVDDVSLQSHIRLLGLMVPHTTARESRGFRSDDATIHTHK